MLTPSYRPGEMVAVMNFVANEIAGDQALDLGVR
jgi:hypothetical protein